MNAIDTALRRCRQDARLPVAGFLPAGFPDHDRFVAVMRAAFDAGATTMEVGIPLAPPALDGEVITAAFDEVPLSVAEQIDLLSKVATLGPVVVMTYAHGVAADRLAAHIGAVTDAGAAGLLVPDLDTRAQLRLTGSARLPVGVFVAAKPDLDRVIAHHGTAPGFVYLRSSPQVTGQPIDLTRAHERLRDVRAALAGRGIPVFVGFGVRTAEQVADLLDVGADAVVVGTAVVEAARAGPDAVADLVRGLSTGMARSTDG
jgi:tryptophan synthase alpha chain